MLGGVAVSEADVEFMSALCAEALARSAHRAAFEGAAAP